MPCKLALKSAIMKNSLNSLGCSYVSCMNTGKTGNVLCKKGLVTKQFKGTQD